MKQIPYAKQSISKQDIKAVAKALGDDYLTQGPKVEAFERAVAKCCGAKYAVAVNSGTSALHIACLAAGLKPGDEAITSPITFVASANCILYCGAKPVFADIKTDTGCIDPKAVQKKINKKTKVIIPVHFAGQPCDMEKVYRLARSKGITIIEDACHALGAEYKRSRVGSCKYSDMTVLSFHAVKHIVTGEGGMVLTNSKQSYEQLLILRSHGITRTISSRQGAWYYEMKALGFNYRITDFQSVLGLSQLKQLKKFIKRRNEIVRQYDRAFASVSGIRPLLQEKAGRSSHHLYILRFNINKPRNDIFNAYRREGILVNVHYIPVYWQPYYRQRGYKKGLCPKAEAFYEQAITLPLFPAMKDSDVGRVINITREIIK